MSDPVIRRLHRKHLKEAEWKMKTRKQKAFCYLKKTLEAILFMAAVIGGSMCLTDILIIFTPLTNQVDLYLNTALAFVIAGWMVFKLEHIRDKHDDEVDILKDEIERLNLEIESLKNQIDEKIERETKK